MNTFQHEHIANVVRVATHGTAAAAQRHEQLIRDSWFRCVHEHQLDPTRMQEAIILPQARLREHQDQMEAFLHQSRHYSQFLSLQLKARYEGLDTPVYKPAPVHHLR